MAPYPKSKQCFGKENINYLIILHLPPSTQQLTLDSWKERNLTAALEVSFQHIRKGILFKSELSARLHPDSERLFEGFAAIIVCRFQHFKTREQ